MSNPKSVYVVKHRVLASSDTDSIGSTGYSIIKYISLINSSEYTEFPLLRQIDDLEEIVLYLVKEIPSFLRPYGSGSSSEEITSVRYIPLEDIMFKSTEVLKLSRLNSDDIRKFERKLSDVINKAITVKRNL